MALKILQSNNATPFGQFDGLDSQYLSLKGGEVVTLAQVLLSANDKATKDVFDGYQPPGTNRAVVQLAAGASRPLFLADDGISGYGTLFGSVVGGVAGQVTTPVVLGPSTATGSGKVTCWSNPGLYAVSLDACDTTATTGLQPTNNTGTLITGAPLNYTTTTALLTPATGSSTTVGRFVDFETNGSLVTTPSSLVGTLNTPDGALSGTPNRTLSFAVFYWNPPVQ